MKTLAVYHKSVPNGRNEEKVNLLNFFSQGAKRAGDSVIDVNDYQWHDTDVGVIQGWMAPGTPSGINVELRNKVVSSQLNRGKYAVAVDSNLFLYANTANPFHYLRYSFNGVFPNTGIYCDTEIDPARWIQISKDLGISLKDYRTNGCHILLCLQRNGGWSMDGLDVQGWARRAINAIRIYSDRPIIIRPHPGDKKTKLLLQSLNYSGPIPFSDTVKLSKNEKLIDDLKNCWAAVNHNSSPVVGAAIEGVPVFVLDPERSQCRDIANTDITQIENPTLHDRQQWVERLAMSHWKFDELLTGDCWRHMRQFIK
jgi:hypothetical protein